MAITSTTTDVWLSHLVFSEPRVIDGELVDGVFYGNDGVVGDASGGIVALNSLVSFLRKEDWLYKIKEVSVLTSSGGTSLLQTVSSGPAIQTPTGVQNNPVFALAEAAIQAGPSGQKALPPRGSSPFADLLVFGDKKIAGSLGLLTTTFGTNTLAAAYQVSIYGFLFRYTDFFRARSLRGTPFMGVR